MERKSKVAENGNTKKYLKVCPTLLQITVPNIVYQSP